MSYMKETDRLPDRQTDKERDPTSQSSHRQHMQERQIDKETERERSYLKDNVPQVQDNGQGGVNVHLYSMVQSQGANVRKTRQTERDKTDKQPDRDPT